jgi:crossover junction endodeoxyribonuclease RuvC
MIKKINKSEKIILGIDPGTTIMGYGLIQIKSNTPQLIALGSIEMHKLPHHYLKLRRIFDRVLNLIDEFLPDELAIEAPFFGKNVQSMLKLGRAQGSAISAALQRDIPVFEYAPRKIKLSITGKGDASKEQVAAMLKSTLNLKSLPKNLDATDGLAAALCHFYQKNTLQSSGKSKSWKEFIEKNPGRTQ